MQSYHKTAIGFCKFPTAQSMMGKKSSQACQTIQLENIGASFLLSILSALFISLAFVGNILMPKEQAPDLKLKLFNGHIMVEKIKCGW